MCVCNVCNVCVLLCNENEVMCNNVCVIILMKIIIIIIINEVMNINIINDNVIIIIMY